MTKIKATNRHLADLPKKYCRLVLTEDAPNHHRLVETKEGYVEYRMGVGKWEEITQRKFITLIRSAVQGAKSHHVQYLALELKKSSFPKLKKVDSHRCASIIAENLVLAAYEFTKYKSKTDSKDILKEVLLCGITDKDANDGFSRGCTVGDAVNLTRDIANTPALDMSPTILAQSARNILAGTKARVKVLGEKELKKLKMNLLLAVGQGTREETKLIVIEYFGATSRKESPIVLVGKGITYDTGGLNVKPSGYMHEMHMDMTGGATVIGAMNAIAKLKLKKNVIALIPSAENAISDNAMRAGDIVTSMSGKTVEIVHTDAEGRLILADALTYADRFKPKVVLDVATLTGAALAALGQHASAILTKDEKLQNTLMRLGEESGDYVWPFPLWEEYSDHIKSSRADIANIAPNFSRYGGTIEGGTFLAHFAGNWPWAHIDIAPRMTSVPQDRLAKGAPGDPVRLLVRFVETNE